jgi:dTDP-4-amino-4,6-dideoxygalactose transaminase
MEVCERHGIPVIEDAAEALGARYSSGRYAGRAVGTIGLIGCYSFNGNKIITSAGGGMIVTADAALAARAKHLTTQARQATLEYRHDEVGFNYRLTNVAAALGLAQLEQLSAFLARKREIAMAYDEAFSDIPGLERPCGLSYAEPSNWLYSCTIDPATFGASARSVITTLRSMEIESRPLWTPLHVMPLYSGLRTLGGAVSERLFDRGLSLPSSVSLSRSDLARVAESVRRCTRLD